MKMGSLSLDDVQKLFMKFLKKAEQELGRKARSPIPILKLLAKAPILGRKDLGIVSGLGELILPTCESWMMKGILALEAFKLMLPASIAGLSHATNLAWGFAHQQLDNEEKERWHILWLETPGVGEKVDLGDLLYDPVEALVLLEYLSDGKGLGELVKMLARLDRFHIRLGAEDFVRQVKEFISKYKTTLTFKEIRIMDLMLQEADISIEEVVKRTNFTSHTVSSIQTSLRQRGIIYTQPVVNLSRLGYQTHLLYLTPKHGAEEEVLEKLRRHKYITSLIHFVNGMGGYMATFTIPDEVKGNTELDLLKKELSSISLPGTLLGFRRMRRLHFVNFRSYLAEKGGWHVKWRTWALWLRRMLEEGLPDVLPAREKVVIPQKAPALDSKDHAILAEISRGEWRLRQLREKLRIGSNTLAIRMKRFRREKIIEDEVGLRFIGLDDAAFLLFYGGAKETSLLIAGLNELPFHVSAELEGDKRGLFTTLYLPQGTSSTLARYIRMYLPKSHLEIRFGIQIPLTLIHFPPQELQH